MIDARRAEQLDRLCDKIIRGGGAVIAGQLFISHRIGEICSGPDLLAHVRGRWLAFYVSLRPDPPMSQAVRKSAHTWERSRFDCAPLFVWERSPGEWHVAVPEYERDACEEPREWSAFFL